MVVAGTASPAAGRLRIRRRVGTGLLLHAERPVGPTGLRHGTAWTTDLPRFVALFAVGRGRSVLAALSLNEQVPLHVARVWPDATRAGFYDHLEQRRGRYGLERFCPVCLDVPAELLEFYEARVGQGACYLLHFDRPAGRKALRHYVGFTTDAPRRFLQHRRGERAACRPARLARRLGIGVRLGRTWFPGSLELERQLQQAPGVEATCRICQAEGTATHAPPSLEVSSSWPNVGSPTLERAWNSEDDQVLLAGFAKGVRVVDLALQLERSKAAVRKRLRDHGKLTRWGTRDDAELREAAAQGVGVGALAKRFGRSREDVQARLDRQAEIDANRRRYPRGGGKWTKELDRELVRRFDVDQPISDIAEALGRSTGGIRRRLEKLGKLDRTIGS